MDKETLLYSYFSNSLTEDERNQFQKLLETDAGFKEQFELEQNLKRVIRKKESQHLKSKLIDFEHGIEKPATTSNWKAGIRKWSMAASVALLMALGWYGYNAFSGADYNELYNANFQQYPNTVYTITRGDNTDTSLERQAFEAYELKQYQIAINYFKELKDKTGLDYVDFYLGQSYLSNGENLNAIVEFAKISSTNSDYKAEALWYEALAQLKLEKTKESVLLLQALLQDGSYKKQEAQELLEKLN